MGAQAGDDPASQGLKTTPHRFGSPGDVVIENSRNGQLEEANKTTITQIMLDQRGPCHAIPCPSSAPLTVSATSSKKIGRAG